MLCSVRTMDYDTLENRVIRDFSQRSVSEVRRTEHPHQDLKEWARKCSVVDQNLGVLCSVRTMDYETLENRVIRSRCTCGQGLELGKSKAVYNPTKC